jgi:MFS family permease
VGIITAVQELTHATYQARVVSLLEAIASAMPGVGFLLGGVITTLFDPRLSFAVAGIGGILVLVAAAVRLRDVDWTPELEQDAAKRLNGASSVAGEDAPRVVLTDS